MNIELDYGRIAVVNVLMPHPRLPLVAISGIDNQVSIYGPSSDRNRVDAENLVGEYETIKKRNERDAGRRMPMPTVLVRRMPLLSLVSV